MKTIGEVYLHVGNSGATIEVVDAGSGPEIRILTSAFGNLTQSTQVKTTRTSLQALAKLFAAAAEYEFSPEYVHAANLREETNSGIAGSSKV